MLNLILTFGMLLAGAPFDDVHHRFSVDLPAGWAFAPMPGDTQGATFRKATDAGVAQASIRVVQLEPKTDLDAFAQIVSGWATSEAGYRRLAKELTFAAGLPAMRLRYVMAVEGNTKISKLIEERFVIDGTRGYVLHVEAMADKAGGMESDFQQIFGSFVPTPNEKSVVPLLKPAAASQEPNAKLIGRWVMIADRATVIAFNQDGTIAIDDVKGVYQVRGHQLLTRMIGTDAETFDWSIQGDVMTMVSPNLPEPIAYAREGSPTGLAGLWVGSNVRWQLSLSGAITWGNDSGRFTTDAGQLLVTLNNGKKHAFQYAQNGNTLSVAGEKFGKGITLMWQPTRTQP